MDALSKYKFAAITPEVPSFPIIGIPGALIMSYNPPRPMVAFRSVVKLGKKRHRHGIGLRNPRCIIPSK